MMKGFRFVLILAYFLLAAFPLLWLGVTSIKHKADTTSLRAKFVPTLDADVSVDSHRFGVTFDAYRNLLRARVGTRRPFGHYLVNSVIIAALSTLAAVLLGTFCAYGFSRFRIAGSRDWLFFILSTRFLPPLAVVLPVFLMYRTLELEGTHAGLIILYTAFNLSLSVWLMRGFIDNIPKAYEEAALVDGYTRLHSFFLIVLPQCFTGMAVTAVFCLISAWNEYGFALALNQNSDAVTTPVYFAGLQGDVEGLPWPQIAVGVLVFVLPIVLFTVLVRRHLLVGMTYGTVKQ